MEKRGKGGERYWWIDVWMSRHLPKRMVVLWGVACRVAVHVPQQQHQQPQHHLHQRETALWMEVGWRDVVAAREVQRVVGMMQ